MFKKTILILFIAFNASVNFAQKKASDKPDSQKKSTEKPEAKKKTDEKTESGPKTDSSNVIIGRLILQGLNKIRSENNIDSLEFNPILVKASDIQSENMADNGKAVLENSKGKYKNTAKRVVSIGGTKNAEEIVISLGALKGKNPMAPQEIADAALLKWSSGKKEQVIIKNGNYVYASPSVAMDGTGKKAFISVVFGSFNTFNAGVKKRKEMKVRFTKKNKKIKSPDDKSCKNCEKFTDYDGLLKGVYVEDKKIFLKYDNLKSLSKLIGKSGDGLAVDIIQREQYEKPDYNIMNNNLLSKGVLTKTVSLSKMESKNRAEADKKGGKMSKLDVQIGMLPKKLTGAYEINLLVIQDGKLCRTLVKSYIEQGEQNSNNVLKMLLMPDSAAYFKPPFSPKADDAILNFSLPFEKNKFEYKEEDITPFLSALNEPDFIISSLYITAYSSIEGDAAANVKLQKNRSENIIKALGKMQKTGVVTSIKTNDSWDMFKTSMAGGPYDTLTKMTKDQAIHEINTKKGLSTELEPFLAKQRFAEIVMEVTYDISGPKEEKFSLSKFNQAAKKADIKQALKIQYYIGSQVRAKKYKPEVFTKMEIPNDAKFSGVLNNQLVLHSMANNNTADLEDYKQLKKLSTLDPSNNIVAFNTIFCALKLDSTIGDRKEQSAMQGRIDALYKTNVPKKTVDALNIEWQFKIITALDTGASNAPIIAACTEKVKSFYNLKESNWQNNLKLSYVFARFRDYKYACNLLAPFVKKDKTNEQVLFAYISFCAQVPELVKSHLFVTALQKAEKINHARYCKLFGDPFLTFQVLDNPFVKDDYNKFKCN